MIADQKTMDEEIVDAVTTNVGMMVFKAWQDQYQLIHHLILYSNILMVVQGRKQSGKSTYLTGLASKLPSEFSCHIIRANQVQSVESLDLTIRQLFSLNSLSSEENTSTPSLMAQLQKKQKHCLLMIDDAHLLCEEVLTTLMIYIQSQEKDTFFHCLLMGDPLLSAKFSEPAFASSREAMTHFIDLPELEVQDVRLLLARKFSSLGNAQISAMSDEGISTLSKQANGNLKILCELAEQSLKTGQYVKKQSFIDKFTRRKNAKAVGTALAGLAAFVVVLSFKAPVSTKQDIQQLVLPEVKMPEVASLQTSQETKENEDTFELRPQLASTVELTKTESNKPHNNYVPMSMIPNYKLLASTVDKTKALASTQAGKGSIKHKGEDPANTTLGLATKPEVMGEIKSIARSEKPLIITKKNKSDLTAKIKVVKTPKAVRQQLSNTQIVKAKAKGFGIQLAASTDLQALKRMARAHHVYSQARYYTTTRKGKQWYMLVLGDYGSKAQASKAKGALPKSIQVQKPWPRSIKGLKEVK